MPGLDFEKLVRRNAIVYRCLTPSPAQALLFGNGVMGGSVCTPDDSLRIQVGRGDIWNENARMGAIAAVRIRGGAGLFSGASQVRQECHLLEARITIDLWTESGTVKFVLTCLHGVDLLVVEIEDHRAAPSGFVITMENWHSGETVEPREGGCLETWHVNRTSSFSEMNARVGVDAAEVGLEDPLLGRTWGLALHAPDGVAGEGKALRLPAGAVHQIRIATGCAAPEKNDKGEESVKAGARRLLDASDEQIRIWRTAHRQFWRDFWSKSALSLHSGTGDAEYEERLWYVTLYTLAIGRGGDYPIRCFGGNFLLDQDNRDWDGGYWFQNMREVYWPLLASGHWEHMRSFFRMYFQAEKFVRAQTRSIFQIDGLCYRETQTFWGLDVNTDLPAKTITPVTHYYFSSNLECCLLMEWYYQASGDGRFLREEFYPFLKGVLAFYLGYAKRGGDGIYHLSPVSSLETWLDVEDDLPNICGLHHFLPKALAWGAQFGEDPALLAQWREFLEHLAAIPVGRWTLTRRFTMGTRSDGIHNEDCAVGSELDPGGLFLPAAGLQSGKTKRHNMENAELYAIFPWGRVGIGSPAVEKRRAENTWNNRTWRYPNNSWAQDTLQLARMGWADRAGESLSEHASYSQRFPNGCFIGPAVPHFHGLLASVPFLDGSSVHAAALNEMLLQSHDGIIRIAPAVPPEWSGRFKLHALGGFVLEAEFAAGRPSKAVATAQRDALFRVANVSPVPMRIGAATFSQGGIFERAMRAGETVVLAWPDTGPPAIDPCESRPEVVWPGYKIRPPHVVRGSGHWHDERKGHGQIGLLEDGLFPATRKS